MANCIPTLIVNIDGKEVELRGTETSENATFEQMLSNIAAANKETIESWEGYKLSPVSVEKHVDLRYITGNTTLGAIKSKINTLSREYNPTKAGIEALMDRINSLGDVNIIWIDGDLKLNGTSIPNVNIFEDGKDLIVLKSNNLSEIFSTLRQYFYEKVILSDKNKTVALAKTLLRHIDSEIARFPNDSDLEKLRSLVRPENLIELVLYNHRLGRLLDSHVDIKGQSGREEVNALLEELTKTITSKRVLSTNRYRANPTSPNIAEHFVVVPDSELIYRNRTIANATESDITIALAENFNTSGEERTAEAAGEKLVKSELNKSSQEIADELWQQIVEKGLPQENILLNIAGNGLSNLAGDLETYDRMVLEIISLLLLKGLKIREIRSGGQTGIDEAGTKAAIALNLPWTVLAPEGYAIKLKSGKTSFGREAFIKRFDTNYSEGVATINGVDDNGDGTLTITNPLTKETYIVRADKYKMADDLLSISSRRIFPDPKLTAKSGGSITYNRTWEGIISGNTTATTKVLTGKNDKFWSELKPDTVIKFRNTFDKDDPNAEYIYVTVTGVNEITLDMANDPEFVLNWATREGLSESYFKTNILPKIKAGLKVYLILYRLSDPRYNNMLGIQRRQLLIEDAKTMRDYILGTKKVEDADMILRFMSKFLNTEC